MPQSSRLEFLETFSANNFALSDEEGDTFQPLNWGGIADLPLLRTLLAVCPKSWEPNFWETVYSFVLLPNASLAASTTLLQWLLACLKDSEDLPFWYKWKKWFLWAMTAAQAVENHGDDWGLPWYFQWGIYTSIPTWIHSQNSRAAAEAHLSKISSHGASFK